MELLDFTLAQWCVAALCAFMIGFAKMGISGAGFLVVPLLAGVMDSRESTGFLLPILSMADIFAILWWHRHVDARQILRLFIPWTLIGVVCGWLLLEVITSRQLMPVIGILTILLIVITRLLNRPGRSEIHLPSSVLFAGSMGILAGATSMLANAAGAVMTIYLLAMKFDKKKFIGTNAVFFFVLNLTKIPFSMNLDLVNKASFATDLVLLPAILCGCVCGVWLVHKIDQKKFNQLVMTLAVLSSLFLCVKPLFIR